MRFALPILAALALWLPTMAEAGRGIPIVRGSEQHMAFVSQTDIRMGGGKPMALCHFYETHTVYWIALYTESYGYVLSDSDCEGSGYFDSPTLIAEAFANGQIPQDVPQTASLPLTAMVMGHAWIAIGGVLFLGWLISRRGGITIVQRRSRLEERMEVLGLPDGPVFRFIDAMLHAANADGRAQPEEVDYIRDKATEIAQLEYTPEHIEWAIGHTDRLRSPRDFQRFGRGLTPEQARVVLRAALAVVAADGSMSRAERRFIAQLTSGLMLDAQEVDRILGTAPGAMVASPA